jgi:Domain of unknown function (DUF4203)
MMLPQAYALPAAITLMVGGALACFAGYRLFRIVLGLYGFILGAMVASSMMGVNNAAAMLIGAVVGGLIGAVVLVFAYIVGIALAGAGLGAAIAHLAWTQFAADDPPMLALVVPAIAGAIAAMLVQRYMIIVCTAFGGAWTIVIGAVNMLAARGVPRGGLPLDVWILYPASLGDERWAPYAWIVIGLIGSSVQLSVTGKKR